MQDLTIKTSQGIERSFTVEPAGKGYLVTGKRGAVYCATRYINAPDKLHLIAWGGTAPFSGVVLTDAEGELRQV